jgi:hypothetical protein
MRLGRAKNMVLTFLESKLPVPKIYIDADWDGEKIDVLAIDRDGVGDVHAVLLFQRPYLSDGRLDLVTQHAVLEALIARFSDIRANYKYIAAAEVLNNTDWKAIFRVPNSLTERLFSPDGIGRVGILHVDASEEADPPVFYVLPAERFRAKVGKLADEYIEHHTADWELRT